MVEMLLNVVVYIKDVTSLNMLLALSSGKGKVIFMWVVYIHSRHQLFCYDDPLTSLTLSCYDDPLTSLTLSCYGDPLTSLTLSCYDDPLTSLTLSCYGDPLTSLTLSCYDDPLTSHPVML